MSKKGSSSRITVVGVEQSTTGPLLTIFQVTGSTEEVMMSAERASMDGSASWIVETLLSIVSDEADACEPIDNTSASSW